MSQHRTAPVTADDGGIDRPDAATVIAEVRRRRAQAKADRIYYGAPSSVQAELDTVTADLDAVLAAIPELTTGRATWGDSKPEPGHGDSPAGRETLKQKFDRYVQARGLVFGSDRRPNGRKVCEEATELAIEITAGNAAKARLELADVIIAATRQADLMGTTVEDCIEGRSPTTPVATPPRRRTGRRCRA